MLIYMVNVVEMEQIDDVLMLSFFLMLLMQIILKTMLLFWVIITIIKTEVWPVETVHTKCSGKRITSIINM